MKHKIVLYLVFCLFFSMNAFAAEEVTVGSLKYSLNGSEAYVVGYEGEPTDVVIPATIESEGQTFKVTKIDNNAFRDCNTLTSIKSEGENLIRISGNIRSGWIDYYYVGAFSNCTSLQSISFPYVKYIEKGVFYNCTSLQSVSITSVQSISAYVFYKCSKLQKADLGLYLQSIEGVAFEDCTSLSYIVIPSGCTVANNVFQGCSRLQSIIYLGNQTSQCGSNATVYHPKDQIHWSGTEFDYQGIAPTVTFTSDMPVGFVPTAYDMAALEKNVGTYTQNIPFTFANNDMSFDVEIPYTYTINPMTLKAKVTDASREYGDVDPQFSSTYTGFVNNEDASVITSHGTYTTTAKATSDVGTYTINQSGATSDNYVFEYEEGTLTVNKAPLTMTVNDKSITYGNSLPTFDVTYVGLKNNETKPKWSTEPTITTTATAESNAGTYLIEINDADATNYTLTTGNGTLTINKAALSIKADSKKKLYCEQNPEFTYSCEGFVKNETDAVLSTKPQLSTTAITNSAVGIYPIEISGAEATNYSISYQNAELEIQKRTLTASAKNYTRAYGEENPVFEIQYNGFVNDEDENVLTAKPKATTEATATSDVGEYSIVVDNGVAENYDFIYNNGILTIEKAYQTLTWDQNFSDVNQYDQIELIATASSGLAVTYIVEGDPICSIVKIGNKYYLDCTDVGETVIVAIQEGSKNYWQSTKISKPIVIKGSSDYINGHEYVDLGLPSGKLWAKTNLGSTSETGYGNYVDWYENDIVTESWGSDWGTPSYSDYEELINTCSWTWSTKNGVNGYIVEGINGNSIFFPAAGFRIMNGPLQMEGEGIYYWTNSLLPTDASFAYMLSGSSSSITPYATFNISLMSAPIRPIVITQSSGIKGIIVDDKGLNIYNLDGTKRNKLHKGINIVKTNDGKTKKIVVK